MIKENTMERITADRIVTINVDVQNDFLPSGALGVAEGDQVVAPLNELNRFTRENGGTVIATGDQHPATTPHFDIWPVHCIADTEGAALSTDLEILPEDIIINKGMGQTDGYSGYEGVTSDGRTIEQIVSPSPRERVALLIGGLATDYCVLNTALDAARQATAEKDGTLSVFVIRDAIRAVNINPEDGANAIKQMEEAGAIIVDSIDILTGQAIELAKA